MSLGLAFWIIILIWLLLGFYGNVAPNGVIQWPVLGGTLILFILLVLLGWKAFGPPLHG